MKKILIWILVLTLVAVASAVATIAYFMYDTPLEENTMTVGNASIEIVEYQRGADGAVEPFVNDKLLIPSTIDTDFSGYAVDYENFNASTTTHVDWNSIKEGYKSPIWDPANINDEIDKMVFVRNKGNTDIYIRVCFAFEAGNYVWKSHFDRMVHLNKNETDWAWDWYNDGKVVEMNGTRYYIAWATYNHVLPAGEYTEISLSQIALDVSAINDHARAFGDTYDVKVFAQGIQVHGFEGIGGLVNGAPVPSKDAPAALNKGFSETIPFKNVKEVNFVDLPTALHYLNADKNSTYLGGEDKESWVVNSITFGRTEDHIDKVVGCEGVLTANLPTRWESGKLITEADFTAYAYYVPNGENYDIYVLADEWRIYTPAESKNLFLNMKALTKVDTSNLDVSATTGMSYMFTGCSNLKTLDIKDWDVSKVTTMQGMFIGAGITTLDVSGWDVGEVTSTHLMFSGCQSLTSMDMSGLKFGKLDSMYGMFSSCGQLTSVDCSDWGVSNVTNAQRMFWECPNLAEANLSGWDLSKLTTVNEMFLNCKKLEKLYTSGWSLPNVQDAVSMFEACHSLEVLDVSNWNMTTVQAAEMFAGCNKLKALDFSNWKNVTIQSMNSMFAGCNALANVNVSSWNVSAVTDMTNLFKDCASMTAIDISGWDTSSVTNMTQMFYMANNKTSLKTITVGGSWSTASVTTDTNMFSGCASLVGGLGTGYNSAKVDKTYAHIDGGTSNPGYFTYKAPPADATT